MTEPTSEVLASRPILTLLRAISHHFSCALDDDDGRLVVTENGEYEVLSRVKKLIAKRDELAVELSERLAKLKKE